MILSLVNDLKQTTNDLLFFPVSQDSEQINKLLKQLHADNKENIWRLKKENFSGKVGQTFTVFSKPSIVLLGLGKLDKITSEHWRQTAGQLVHYLENYQAEEIGIIANYWFKGSQNAYQLGQALAVGLSLANYQFNKYKKQEDKLSVNIRQFNVAINPDKRLSFKKGWEDGLLLAKGTKVARDLVNEPARVMTPEFLAQYAKSLSGHGSGIAVKILEKDDCLKLGMQAFLSVAEGSNKPPKFIHLVYKPKARTKNKIALVGKGITFDSGGLNIKHDDGMINMKIDMGGAATVLGLFAILPQLKPRAEVHGFIAACENMPSGSALKPGDVVSNLQGKTMEIGNTDAEGRVTLADSLAYAQKKGLKTIIDLATLTGAVMVALGDRYAGLFANNDELAKNILNAAQISGEKIWQLPLPSEYKELNKSQIADVRNIPSSRYGGAISAALFLQEFINNDVAWAHLDIAGPVYAEKPFNSYTPVGGVGFGVRTLAEWLKNF